MNPINKFKKEKEKQIIDFYLKGKTQKEIAKIFNTYNTSIRRVLLRNNIKLRSNSEIQSYVKNNSFLKNINSNYFLGLLITDGCISNGALSLSLKEEDKYMLNNFATFLSSKVKVNSYYHKKHNKKQYYVKIRNKEINNYLQTKANFINKSKDLELYINLNWELLRGVFDGDGGIVHLNNKKSIRWFICSASEKFIKQVELFLKENGYNPTITKFKNIFYINLYRKSEINNLYEDLYKDAVMFLKRKHNIMATFLGKPLK